MANKVFANGRELSCKAGSGISTACFPDVCFTPPDKTPASPLGIPIPYPNFGFSRDTTKGSKTVRISKKEVMLRDKSYFKKSTGDEAAKPTQKKGLRTGVVQGKVYFSSWSPDVKFEKQNVVRHLDMTTHNHACKNANALKTPHRVSKASAAATCATKEKDANDACKSAKPRPKRRTEDGNPVDDGLDCTEKCKKAKACQLRPKSEDKTFCCHADTTGHHLIEVHCFSPTGARGGALEDLEAYNQKDAPCVCASESRADGSHGVLHAVQSKLEGAYNDKPGAPFCEWLDAGEKIRGSDKRANAKSKWRYKHARDAGAKAHKIAFPHCDEECIKKQLDAYHKDQCGFGENTPLRSDPGAATRSSGKLKPKQSAELQKAVDAIRGVATKAGSA